MCLIDLVASNSHTLVTNILQNVSYFSVWADDDNDGKLERSCRNTAAGKLGDRARYGGTYVEYPDNHGEVRHPPKKSQTANRKDLKQLLRFFVSKDEEVDPFLDSCIKEANAIYSLGIQVKVAKALLSNPDRYAGISAHGESRDSEFKKKPNIKTLSDYLAKTSIQSAENEEDSQAKRSLLSQIDDLDKSDEETQPKPQKDVQDNVIWFFGKVE